jgi:hypothetical protein
MKTIKIMSPAVLFLIALFVVIPDTNAQTKKEKKAAKALEIKNLIDSQQYVFYALNAIPTGMRQRMLTSEYTLAVTKEKITCDLPYFGRAFTAPIGSTEGGITFTSTDFEYTIVNRDKGGWDITIQPKNTGVAREMNLTVFDNGTATLQVTSNNRQPISFNGFVKAK